MASKRKRVVIRGYMQGRDLIGNSPIKILDDFIFSYKKIKYDIRQFPVNKKINLDKDNLSKKRLRVLKNKSKSKVTNFNKFKKASAFSSINLKDC